MSKHKKQVAARPWSHVSMTKKLAASNGYSFSTCYVELCRQQRLRPLPLLCVSLPNKLEFTPDRVKMDEWGPILTSISLDRVLRCIRIHSRYQNRKPVEDLILENKNKKSEKTPLVLTRYILERLSHSVAQCVRNSANLTCLELEGIPLTTDCVAILCVGITGTKSLQHLSLSKSYIGDSGCELICQAITTTRCIKTLNLSQCNLSPRCGTALATALSRQKLSLYHDTWKQSLRYRQPDFDAMPGLRRLTLNGNPQLGNSATNKIIDAVKDSLWMKALDLQNCGLTNGIGNDIIDLINKNDTLIIVDVRLNSHLEARIVDEIMRKLEKNDKYGSKCEYKWIGLPKKRIVSATSVRCLRKVYTDKQEQVSRTASMGQQPANRPLAVSARRTLSTPAAASKKINTKETPSKEEPQEMQEEPKATLHIDLQAQIVSKSDAASFVEPHELVQSRDDLVSASTMNELTEQSSPEALREERNSLLEKVESLRFLLNEQRLRRELAEEKLLSMKRSVMELENALRRKEEEMRGYVLVSQDSLDEICMSFDQLLSVLNEMSNAQKTPRNKFGDGKYNMEDMQEKVATLIRRTKSEGARRRGINNNNNQRSSRKIVKSQSSYRPDASTAINIPLRLERDMGDSPDNVSPSIMSTLRESGRRKLSTPIERSRAIFSQLLNGDADLNYQFQY